MAEHDNKKASFSLRPWRKLWPVLRQRRWPLIGAIASNLVLAVTDFYLPLLQAEVVDAFILSGTLAGLGNYVMRYLLIIATELIALRLYFASCMRLEMLSGHDLRETCFVNLQKLSLDYYNVTSAGHSL